MKKILFLVSLLLAFSGTMVSAQTTDSSTNIGNQCSVISSQNVDVCCGGSNYSQNTYRCTQYRDEHQSQSTTESGASGAQPWPAPTTATQSTSDSGAQPWPTPATQTTTVSTTSAECANLQALSAEWYRAGCNAPVTPFPGAGTAGTANGGAWGGTVNTNPSTSAVASPQSGAAELASCNSIRFVSLLDILIWIKCIIVVAVVPLIFALAFMFFLWGVFKFIYASDSTKKEEGKKFIIAGMIGLFVMTSLWGIIKILGTTLGVDSTVPLLQTKDYLKKTP